MSLLSHIHSHVPSAECMMVYIGSSQCIVGYFVGVHYDGVSILTNKFRHHYKTANTLYSTLYRE